MHLGLAVWREGLLDPRELGEARGRQVDEAGLQRAPLHWGMVCANYPVVWEVALVVGRLLGLQGTISLAQSRRRIVETYGERSTLVRASQRIMRSFVDWGVLKEAPEKGIYIAAPASPVSDESLTIWLVEAVLRATNSELGVLSSVLGSPALFPFLIERLPGRMLEQSPRLELHRQNRNEDLVALQAGKRV